METETASVAATHVQLVLELVPTNAQVASLMPTSAMVLVCATTDSIWMETAIVSTARTLALPAATDYPTAV